MQTLKTNKANDLAFKLFGWTVGLFFVFVLMGCGGGCSKECINAQTPVITVQPTGAAYLFEEQAAVISVEAEVTDGGTLSYQWYSSNTSSIDDGIEIIGETNNTYTPPTNVLGTFYYYAEVTNTNTNAKENQTATTVSNIAKIDVVAIVNAQTPVITVQPTGAAYLVGEQAATINMEANVSDNGTLSYQWYSSNTSNISEGVKISGETNDTYTPPTDTLGTFYYYAEVTNTNADVNGNKTATVTSDIAKIDIANMYTISFYDSELEFNQSIDIFSIGIDLPKLIKDYDLPTTLFEVNSSTDISSNTTYSIKSNTNLYAIQDVQEIRTETELSNVRNNLSGKYILFNDITLTDATLDATEGWLPIRDNVNAFTGIFQGSGYKVSGLWINRPSTNNVGLFEHIKDAQIKNLGVETDSSKGGVKGYNFVGNIVGWIDSNSSIANSYSKGNISGNKNVGGVAGRISGGSITNSYSLGNVGGDSTLGGITGGVTDGGSIMKSYSIGSVNGVSYAGGIAGLTYGSIFQYNVAMGPSINGYPHTCRIIGYNGGGTVSDNFALNTIRVNGTDVIVSDLHGASKSNAELKTQSTYESLGWSFGNDSKHPWKIDASKNNGYPYLYWEE
jgi:hypothetical protein